MKLIIPDFTDLTRLSASSLIFSFLLADTKMVSSSTRFLNPLGVEVSRSVLLPIRIIFADELLNKILSSFIILPTWVWIGIPIILLLILGIIDMLYLYPRVQGYYMRNNCEWQEFKEELKKD